jgi:hypothetical protein
MAKGDGSKSTISAKRTEKGSLSQSPQAKRGSAQDYTKFGDRKVTSRSTTTRRTEMAKQEKLDYKPLALHEQKEAFKRDEPVRTDASDGKTDPVNIRSEEAIRNDPAQDKSTTPGI